ncbi:hypothetical protein ITR00_02285 [Pediococcus pentosaceus]|uniref:beta-1,6-N-acetylglucosaminyltransferase n=1 Tax=Pediococcus pentosaceus TaxID=1255 RepID=UPI0019093192|nr:beta-1,6-N-acetylglucosaminyltransferase [Pediococcus pentosaceus]MBF7124916.1 hypothetical protein [Pediococcus pentosaceus]WPK17129.1 beta-1,6-N-acetylglucosaminyltransferase [Pediococcus pentosaceus]
MKQAVLVIGNGKSDVLQQTINILDDKDIDFIIYWDAKDNLPSLSSIESNIYFVESRKKIFWGTDTQIIAERELMKYALELGIEYSFMHLISSKDIPLMEKGYFKEYFNEKQQDHIGFVNNLRQEDTNRVKFYYPIRYINVRNNFGQKIIKLITKINKILRVDRLSHGIKVEKGTNWFSISKKSVKKIVDFPNFKMFMNSYLGDEIYIQTILSNYKNKYKNKYDDNKMAGRLIDWKRGTPYVFSKKDVPYLKDKMNTVFAFARKVEDPSVPKMVFDANKSKDATTN